MMSFVLSMILIQIILKTDFDGKWNGRKIDPLIQIRCYFKLAVISKRPLIQINRYFTRYLKNDYSTQY